MAVRAIYRDEYQVKRYNYKGTRYTHVEHARWSALWDNLGFEFEYRPRKHTMTAPEPGHYVRGEDTMCYSPHFYLKGLDVFIDIKKEPPKSDSIYVATDLFRLTGIPIVMFQGPMFVPNWTGYSPPATFCREVASPQPYYLQFDGRNFGIKPSVNENDVLHARLREAFSMALQI